MKFIRYKSIDKAIVVALDMRSSSSMVDDLAGTGSLSRMADFLSRLKHFFADELQVERKIRVDPYKFIGDAWVLLFLTDTPGRELLYALRDLCHVYEKSFEKLLQPVLTEIPKHTGLAFGIADGPLLKTTIFQTTEYIAPALNVAARLQVHAKTLPTRFGVMCAADAYDRYFAGIEDFKFTRTAATLPGLQSGVPFPCVHVDLMP